MKDSAGRGFSGDVHWGQRVLCQGVPYLVLRSPAQEFSLLIRAGQRVAAAVTPHVERGIHRVGEVGRLVRVKGKIGIQEAPDIVGLSTFVHLVGGVPDFHIHGPIGHALVLEALGPSDSPLVPEHHAGHQQQQQQQQQRDQDGGHMSRLLLTDDLVLAAGSCQVGWALALGHHLAVHGTGATIATVVDAGQATGGDPAIRAVASDVSGLFVDHAGSLETAAALVHLTLGSLKVDRAATLSGAVGRHLTGAEVLTVARALPVLAAVTQEARETSALGLVALVDGAGAVVGTVTRTHLLGAFGAREACGAPARGHARRGSRTGTAVLAVFPALVQLTLVPGVAGLAAALGLPPGVEEAAAAIEAL